MILKALIFIASSKNGGYKSSKSTGFISSIPSKQPELGSFIYVLVATSVIGGFLFGYDTGIVSSAMLYVPLDDGLKPMGSIWQEIIVSVTPGIAGFGALFAGRMADAHGRRKVIILSCLFFVTGLAIGVASMIVPIYVSEASPTHIRGRLLTSFEISINMGMLTANIIAGGFSYISPTSIGWRLMFGFAAVPALVQLLGFLYLPESPRWLYTHKSTQECEQVLEKVYNKDVAWIAYELSEIELAHQQELKEKQSIGTDNILARIVSTPPVRKALIIGCCLQAFQQLSGINTIMYYTGAIIRSAGVRDNHTAIWISAGTAGVKTVSTAIPCVITSLCLMGGAFYLINHDSDLSLQNMQNPSLDAPAQDFSECFSHSNCDYCVTDEKCGFCSLSNGTGFCLPKDSHDSELRSSTGQCASNTGTEWHLGPQKQEYEWMESFCHTKYTVLPILIMVLYLSSFAVGYGPLPWLLNAEFYPLWARGTCVSISTFCNWSFNLLISLTFLSLSQAATKFGAFFIYAALTGVALIFFIKFVPETRGCSLDEVELLFMSKEERRNAVFKTQIQDKSILEDKAN
uniref:Major facilitator superfamily (MFS) profile domain-containing protein n=1 Tax=Ditylenchus dipsaci TaxID=166011 RepID=A0A915EHF9_9BILA